MQLDWRCCIGEQDVCNAVSPTEVVVQCFHETAVLVDQSNQELILELVLHRYPDQRAQTVGHPGARRSVGPQTKPAVSQ